MGDLVELDIDACITVLTQTHLGRLALNDEDGPMVVPVNYVFDRGAIVFRSALGTKLEAAEQRQAVSLEIDHIDEERRLGWSVLVRGRLDEVTDAGELDRLRALPLEPFAGGDRLHYLALTPTAISGRRIGLPAGLPRGWLRTPDLGNIWYGSDASDLLG